MIDFLEISRFERWLKSHTSENYQKIDYSYKSKCLKNGLDKSLNTIKLHEHYNIMSKNNFGDLYGLYIPQHFSDDSLTYWFDDLAHKFGFCSILEARRINDARYHRTSRLRSRISSIISCSSSDSCSYFLTLTFTNKVLDSTSKKTRREYVTRYLKSISLLSQYVANIDFGSKNGREHYHAVVSSDFIDNTSWKYGAMKYEIINSSSDKDSELLSKYISKLTNHAIKETTKRSSLIYPKFRH